MKILLWKRHPCQRLMLDTYAKLVAVLWYINPNLVIQFSIIISWKKNAASADSNFVNTFLFGTK